MPTGGNQPLMAQNPPMADHTVAGVPLTSVLRDRPAAEAAE